MGEAGQDPRASAGPAAGLKDGVGVPEPRCLESQVDHELVSEPRPMRGSLNSYSFEAEPTQLGRLFIFTKKYVLKILKLLGGLIFVFSLLIDSWI